MKSFRKGLAALVTLLLLFTALSVFSSAAAGTFDFENGKIPDGIFMALKDDGSADGDPSKLSVVDFNGSKMLKVDPQNAQIPKVKFDVAKLLGDEAYKNVRSIEYDMIIENPDNATMTDWNGGTIGATPTGGSGWNNGTEWTIQDDKKNVSDVFHQKETIKAGFEFTDPTKSFFMFMNWGNNKNNNIYFDNIVFKDASGNVIAPAAAAAPAAAGESPKTGDPGVILYGLTAVASLAGLVSVRRKRK